MKHFSLKPFWIQVNFTEHTGGDNKLWNDSVHNSELQFLSVARRLLQERPLQFQHRNVRVKSWPTVVQLLANFQPAGCCRRFWYKKTVRNRQGKILYTELLKSWPALGQLLATGNTWSLEEPRIGTEYPRNESEWGWSSLYQTSRTPLKAFLNPLNNLSRSDQQQLFAWPHQHLSFRQAPSSLQKTRSSSRNYLSTAWRRRGGRACQTPPMQWSRDRVCNDALPEQPVLDTARRFQVPDHQPCPSFPWSFPKCQGKPQKHQGFLSPWKSLNKNPRKQAENTEKDQKTS